MLAEAGQSTRAIAILLFIAGVAVQTLGLATSFLEAEVGHGYYNQRFDYRLGYNALAVQAGLLVKYLNSHEPVRIGLGFDRWFVFLGKAGVSHGTLGALGLAMAGCAVLSTAALVRRLRHDDVSPAPILPSSPAPTSKPGDWLVSNQTAPTGIPDR